jgi:hypothetical protein
VAHFGIQLTQLFTQTGCGPSLQLGPYLFISSIFLSKVLRKLFWWKIDDIINIEFPFVCHFAGYGLMVKSGTIGTGGAT